jgi:FtsP/CotA-like multicopper oxidase with cupredoxin domain
MHRSSKVCVAALAAWLSTAAVAEPLPGGTLDLTGFPQFVEPLVIPPVMPAAGLRWDASARRLVPYYEIEVVQFQQQILPAGFPKTTVWSYGAVGRPETRNYPAFTIENLKGIPTRVKWVNGLVDKKGKFLPHLLPVDQTLHWANPPRYPCMHDHAGTGTDCRPGPETPAEVLQAPYTGPVPIITHVHGAHVQPDSDGYPEAWYLPDAKNIPKGYARHGTRFDQIPSARYERGAATFQYRNDQPSTTLWYHDHTLGMTRVNVYAGPAGFYLVRELKDALLGLPGPAPLPGLDPNGNPLVRRLTREIPIVIQDRSFNRDGSLFYPDNRDFFEGLEPRTLAKKVGIEFSPVDDSDIAPIWNPEFFGNTMVVNGKTWPRLEVERRKYRLRLLNGSNSRFLILRFEGEQLPFHQIGAEQGFLPAPVTLTRLLMAPAERADVIVDFSQVPAGTRIVLQNIGPDEPFGGGEPCLDTGVVPPGACDFLPADPGTTGVVMAFDVVSRRGLDLSRIPPALPAEGPLPASSVVRKVSLNEEMSMNQVACFDGEGNLVLADPSDPTGCPEGTTQDAFGPAAAKLGSIDDAGTNTVLAWSDAVTENPALGAVETWKIYNFTEDAHPIHPHLVRFKVVGRQSLEDDAAEVPLETCDACKPEPNESGYKDTVIAYPGEVTTIKARFDLPGLYVWHCHIVEHEDNEMMRPYCVGGQDTCPVPIIPPMAMP